MLAKLDTGKKKTAEDSAGRLLNDLETFRRALYPDKPLFRASIAGAGSAIRSTSKTTPPKSKVKQGNRGAGGDDLTQKGKKSIWNWKPLKALSIARNKKFRCSFSIEVHSVEGLPYRFEDTSLCVHWKKRDGELFTRPSKVMNGVAEFDEILTHECIVNGNRSGPHHSAKYDAKHFMVFLSVVGAKDLDLGKHRIDLTRLLPLSLEELEEEKSSGNWTTSFKLSGDGKGGLMNVSFSYAVANDSPVPCGSRRVGDDKGITNHSYLQAARALPRSRERRPMVEQSKAGISSSFKLDAATHPWNVKTSYSLDHRKSLSEMLSDLSVEMGKDARVSDSEQDKDELISTSSLEHDPIEVISVSSIEQEIDSNEFTSDAFQVEDSTNAGVPEETSDSVIDFQVECDDSYYQSEPEESYNISSELDLDGVHEEDKASINGEFIIDEISAFSMESSERSEWKNPVMEEIAKDSLLDVQGLGNLREECSSFCEEDIENVANDFLDLLGLEPESPRECLLRNFEQDSSFSLFDFEQEQTHFSDELEDLDSILKSVEEEHEMEANTSYKLSAKSIEDMESEALMREFGLDDNSFQSPPPNLRSNNEAEELPPLGDGLGSFIQTKDGGFLRSMSPHNFKNSKNGGSLIMQVSSPVVVPAEMGSDVMEILQGLASIGVEKLSVQANKLMPLEDITAKTLEYSQSEAIESKKRTFSSSEYVSLEEIAPLAMEKIETLSLEGLKIQSGMSEEDGTSNINPKNMEGTAGMKLLQTNESAEEVDGLMGLSLTLDEWMKLDSGDLGDEDNISERTSQILAAHHANSLDTIRGSKGEKRRRGSARKGGGLLGDNFTVALLVQLRDPIRDYEPVGTPMLALVQVERVFSPPKPKIYYNISGSKPSNEDDESEEKSKDENEEPAPQFQIQEVHIAGLKDDSNVKKPWGSSTQRQSGSRWLLANGMGKSAKPSQQVPQVKSKPNVKPNIAAPMAAKAQQPQESLWSISSRVHAGKGSNWNQPGKFHSHLRNPNVLLPANSLKRK